MQCKLFYYYFNNFGIIAAATATTTTTVTVLLLLLLLILPNLGNKRGWVVKEINRHLSVRGLISGKM